MNQFLAIRPTAEVAGAEYLAKALVQWPAIDKRHKRRPATNGAGPSAVDAGIEYRTKTSQRRWPELLSWRGAT